MNARPKEELFRAITAENPNISPAFAEKDWFVTQVLAIISQIKIDGFQIIFSGGTALAKAHKLIERFSEDLDFRVIANDSNNTRGKRSEFKKSVIEHLQLAGYAIKDTQIKARDENRFFAVEIDYETYFDRSNGLRPHIQIELIIRSPQLPPEKHPVSSFLNEISEKPPEVPAILCVQPVENAADKLSALAWRIPDRVRNSYNDDRSIVRHIHDLSLLKNKAIESEKFVKMVLHSMECDNSRPKNESSFKSKSAKEKLTNMLTIIESDKKYPKEYDLFVKAMSYALYENQIHDFKYAMRSINELVEKVLHV